MNSAYKCGKCGVVSVEENHVCQPEEVVSRGEFCGSGPEHVSQMCDSMSDRLNFQCNSCGRPTDHPNLVCSPIRIR